MAVLLAAGAFACGKGEPVEKPGDLDKKAHEAAIAIVKQPVALIAAYAPHVPYPEPPDKYAPKHRTDLDKSTLFAANEVRYAANQARQKLETSHSDATKELQGALRAVSEACAEATEVDALTKCSSTIKALDVALERTGAKAAALGVAEKYPRVAPDAITDEAKKAIAPFFKVKGPGANDTAFGAKRVDPKATPGDVITACQAAQNDAVETANAFDKAEEPLRLIGHTRKISLDAQCRRLDEVLSLSKDVSDCRKKAKSPECKIVCGKGQNALQDGLPAAAFAPLEKDYADICNKK